jgi:hypothetical protein
MTNQMYGKGREAFLNKLIDWGTGSSTDNIKALLVDAADYVLGANIDVHQFHSSVTAAGIVATSPNFAGKSVTLGVADANDITFTAVTGDPCEVLIIYQDTGTSATSRLIAYIDTATGLPVTPNGGDITVTWDNGANKIFKL